jgi:hypothetical protein
VSVRVEPNGLTVPSPNRRVLVAAPTFVGKDYCLDEYLDAYNHFVWPEKNLMLVDNTRDDGEYAQHLRDLDVPIVVREEPSRDFEETFSRCWRRILEEAQRGGYDWVLSLETDVIGPPLTLDALLNVAVYVGAPFVTHCYPYHDNRTTEMYQGLGCVLMTTPLLVKAFELHDDPESPAHDVVEGAVYEAARSNSHVSLVTMLPLVHRDAPGGGATQVWDWDEITDPRVVKV